MALIDFNTSPRFAHLGGGAWLPDLSLWPLTPEGKPMMPLDNSFFLIPTLGSDDWAMTVFIAVNYRQNGQAFDPCYARRFAANDQSAFDRFDCAYSKILLHPKGGAELVYPEIDYPLFPKTFIGLRKETEDEIAAESAEIDETEQGLDNSKAYVFFHFPQDLIRTKPSDWLVLQINQFDLDEISPAHEGIWGNGLGYAAWNRNLKKFAETREVGKFFVQTT